MRYYVRRIGLGSVARLGCALGWLVAFFPALLLTGLAIQVLQRIQQLFAQIRPFSITVLGQEIARFDLLEILRLQSTAQTVNRLVVSLPNTFLALAVILLLAGALLFVLIALLFGAGYNLLAANGWGLEIELEGRKEVLDEYPIH